MEHNLQLYRKIFPFFIFSLGYIFLGCNSPQNSNNSGPNYYSSKTTDHALSELMLKMHVVNEDGEIKCSLEIQYKNKDTQSLEGVGLSNTDQVKCNDQMLSIQIDHHPSFGDIGIIDGYTVKVTESPDNSYTISGQINGQALSQVVHLPETNIANFTVTPQDNLKDKDVIHVDWSAQMSINDQNDGFKRTLTLIGYGTKADGEAVFDDYSLAFDLKNQEDVSPADATKLGSWLQEVSLYLNMEKTSQLSAPFNGTIMSAKSKKIKMR